MVPLAIRSASNRWFSLLFAVLALAMSVALYLGVERIRHSAKKSFEATINGVDLIVSARGGDVQILLYSVFNLGNATNNISMTSLDHFAKRHSIEWIVPLSLGDSHRGYRVVGTTNDFFTKIKTGGGKKMDFRAGGPMKDIFGAVIGSTVARTLGYEIDQQMIVSHGLVSAGTAEHDDLPFYVAGILKPTGTPIDQNIYVPLEGIEAIHVDWKNGVKIPGKYTSINDLHTIDLSAQKVTAAMVGVRDKRRMMQIKRNINDFTEEPLSAILPGVALGNLWEVINVVEQSFTYISLAAFIVALLGFIALLNMSLAQRRREMAIYRALGASPLVVGKMLVIEALIVGLLAIFIGLIFVWASQNLIAAYAAHHANIILRFDGFDLSQLPAIGIMLGATVIAAIIPAIKFYRQSLNDGISVTE